MRIVECLCIGVDIHGDKDISRGEEDIVGELRVWVEGEGV